MNTNVKFRNRTGVPLSMLNLIHCPHCRKQLQLKNAVIDGKYVLEGDFWCECGYDAYIKEGILCTKGGYISRHNWPDYQRSFTKDAPVEYINMLQKTNLFLLDKLSDIDTDNLIIYEDHINIYSFWYILVKEMPVKARFIIADDYFDIIKMYKERFEHLGIEMEILYIADSTSVPPLAEQCIDIFFDSYSSLEFMFFNHAYLLDIMEPYLKPDCYVLGSMLNYTDRLVPSLNHIKQVYPESWQKNYDYKAFCEHFIKGNIYENLNSETTGYVTDMANCPCVHVKGDKLYNDSFFWKKLAKK